MNIPKKLFIIAGLACYMPAAFADNWSDAFDAFGGPQNVYANRGKLAISNNIATIKKAYGNNPTPEAISVGMYESQGRAAVIQPNFKRLGNAASVRDLESALQAELYGPAIPVVKQQQEQQAQQQEQQAQQQQVSAWASWFGSQPAAPVLSQADVQQAQQAQQQADVAAAAANDQNLASLVNSGATGLQLYKGYVDLNFGMLQQAIANIPDANVQAQVAQYVQNKFASMKSSVAAANQHNSRILGRMDSKKAKKHKKRS